jgi:hypothetical protein
MQTPFLTLYYKPFIHPISTLFYATLPKLDKANKQSFY